MVIAKRGKECRNTQCLFVFSELERMPFRRFLWVGDRVRIGLYYVGNFFFSFIVIISCSRIPYHWFFSFSFYSFFSPTPYRLC